MRDCALELCPGTRWTSQFSLQYFQLQISALPGWSPDIPKLTVRYYLSCWSWMCPVVSIKWNGPNTALLENLEEHQLYSEALPDCWTPHSDWRARPATLHWKLTIKISLIYWHVSQNSSQGSIKSTVYPSIHLSTFLLPVRMPIGEDRDVGWPVNKALHLQTKFLLHYHRMVHLLQTWSICQSHTLFPSTKIHLDGFQINTKNVDTTLTLHVHRLDHMKNWPRHPALI